MKTMNKLIMVGVFLSMAVVLLSVIPGVVLAQYNGCTYHSYERCLGNNLYWYDSCGTQQDLAQYCQNGCYNNSCQNNYNNYNYNNNCTSNYQERCSGNNLYWYDSCGNQQNLIQYCSNGCYNNSCQNNYNNNNNNNCTYHSYESCSGNYLYWYDSCGTQQDVAQYCTNGCYNNACGYNNYNNNNNNNYNNNNYNYNYNKNNYNNCAYHAYKLCSGNNIYWYDSCGTQQDLYTSCTGGQTCQYGQCTSYIQPAQPTQPISNYTAYFKTACYGNSIYWYDSLGAVSGLYKKCADNNSCTLDTCSAGKCSNILKCDGSTCAVSSADYNTYCPPTQAGQPAQSGTTTQTSTTVPANDQNHCGNGLCEPNLGETNANCPSDCKINTANGLAISFFVKQDANSSQWQKATQANSNGQIYFMISLANNSTAQIDNVNISANIPNEISSLGNLQLDKVPISGDIVSGINIGSVAPSITKSITFEGKNQTILEAGTKQAVATINVSGAMQSDSVSIDFNTSKTPSQTAAAVSSAPVTSGFWGFLGRWYLWILGGLVLIFLFVVVYRRFSSDV